ncbi:cache domain-containing protein [Candidatus Woesearchaeota archaeon]|nr:cache domain-containing protein [Candidatus Woesearchaeota archaeon]
MPHRNGASHGILVLAFGVGIVMLAATLYQGEPTGKFAEQDQVCIPVRKMMEEYIRNSNTLSAELFSAEMKHYRILAEAISTHLEADPRLWENYESMIPVLKSILNTDQNIIHFEIATSERTDVFPAAADAASHLSEHLDAQSTGRSGHWHAPVIDAYGQYVLSYVRIIDAMKPATFAIDVRQKSLEELSKTHQHTASSYMFITDINGSLVSGPNRVLEDFELRSGNALETPNSKLFENALTYSAAGKPTVFTAEAGRRTWIIATAPIRELGWTLGMAVPYDELNPKELPKITANIAAP